MSALFVLLWLDLRVLLAYTCCVTDLCIRVRVYVVCVNVV